MYEWIALYGMAALSMLGAGKKVTGLSRYAYASPKLMILMRTIKTPEQIREMIRSQMKVLDLTSFEVERKRELYEQYGSLKDFLPNNLKALPDLLRERMFIDDVRTLLRARFAGRSIVEVRDSLVLEELKRLGSFKSLPMVVEEEYGSILDNLWVKSFEEVEFKLMKSHYKKFRDKFKKFRGEPRSLWKYYGARIDGFNVMNLLKERTLGVKLRRRIIPYGLLTTKELRRLDKTKTTDEFLKALSKKKDYRPLVRLLRKNLEEPEIQFEKFLIKLGRRIAKRNEFGLGMILRFIIEKDLELRNLRTLIQGKAAGMPDERIEEMIIDG